MDVPIESAKLHFVVTEVCAPRTDRETGQQRTDREGRPIFDIGLLMANGTETAKIRAKTYQMVDLPQLAAVELPDLVVARYELRNGEVVWSWEATTVTPAPAASGSASAAGGSWGPAPGTAKSSGQSAGSGTAGKAGA